MSESKLHFFAIPGPVFKAKYRGECWLCRRRFAIGARIRYIAKNTLAHEGCPVPSGPINDPMLRNDKDASARWEDLPLAPQHVDKLKSTGISPLTAKLRGYETVYDPYPREGAWFNFSVWNPNHVPGLLIPLLDKRGSVWGHQYRPDNPPADGQGKPIEYHAPVFQPNRQDVPPRCGGVIDDTKIEKWITEDALKADALAEQGLCAIALPGVFNGRNDRWGDPLEALRDRNGLPIEDSHLVIAYDSDSMSRPCVQSAVFSFFVYRNRVKVKSVRYLHLPNGPDGQRWGVDDYLAAGHTREEMCRLVEHHPFSRHLEHAAGEHEPQPEKPKPAGGDHHS